MLRRRGRRRRNLHWTLPQSKLITWIYVTRALFRNHLWSVISNEQWWANVQMEDERKLTCARACVWERDLNEWIILIIVIIIIYIYIAPTPVVSINYKCFQKYWLGTERGGNVWEEIYQRWNRERQIKGQDDRKRRERRRLLLKGTFYAPSLPPRAKIHTLFEQHKRNGRKGDVKSERGREWRSGYELKEREQRYPAYCQFAVR